MELYYGIVFYLIPPRPVTHLNRALAHICKKVRKLFCAIQLTNNLDRGLVYGTFTFI